MTSDGSEPPRQSRPLRDGSGSLTTTTIEKRGLSTGTKPAK